jgi:beta-aspartyl-peptidase (threonine type)
MNGWSFLVGVTSMCALLAHQVHAEDASAVRWAIAIHGGAGDPAKWTEAEQAARRVGLQAALEVGKQLLAAGSSSLDAVEAVVRKLEDDPLFNAGRGAVRTSADRAELDASIMDGKTLGCGAVAGVTTVKNPISLARRVMTETKHVLLVAEGAEQFAKEQNVPRVAPEYFLSKNDADARPSHPPYLGTVGCVARDVHGNLAAGTSTGGTDKKLPGRVGDSPIIGAGTYAANDTCAVSGTGIGEEYIRNAVAYDVAAQMRYAGKSLEQAVTQAMRRTLKANVGGLIAVSSTGEIVLQHNTNGMSCGAADSTGRFDVHLQLPDGALAPDANAAADSAADDHDQDRQAVRKLLEQQVAAGNDGDIDRFMEPYWNSDELTFSSSGQITRGFSATRARYKTRYPDREAMGRLSLSDFEMLPLGPGAMQVLGVWKLEREAPIDGRFTLVLRKFPEGWKIVHDHTSARSD